MSGFSLTTCRDAWRATCACAPPVRTATHRTTSPNTPTRAALARPARILCEDALIDYFTDLMYATSALAWASEMFPIAVVMIPDE